MRDGSHPQRSDNTVAFPTPGAPMKLYHSSASPYARKVRVVAFECGLAQRIVEVPTAVAPHDPNRGLSQQNPLMKIPALERDDGSHLYDSAVICEYLDSLVGGRLFPASGEPRWQALRLHALADGVMDAAILMRYETVFRPEALRWPAWIDGQFAKIDGALDAAEQEVDGLPAAFDIGQAGLACALGYLDFRFASRPWRGTRQRLCRWFARVCERPSLEATVPVA